MQWTSERHGGFTRSAQPIQRVIDDATFGYERVNVSDQRRDPNSLLNWTERIIRMRKECPEISWGDFEVMSTSASGVLVLRYDWRGASLVTVHNFADRRVKAAFDTRAARRRGQRCSCWSRRRLPARSSTAERSQGPSKTNRAA